MTRAEARMALADLESMAWPQGCRTEMFENPGGEHYARASCQDVPGQITSGTCNLVVSRLPDSPVRMGMRGGWRALVMARRDGAYGWDLMHGAHVRGSTEETPERAIRSRVPSLLRCLGLDDL